MPEYTLFRTVVEPARLLEPITLSTPLLSIGSCFSESIGNRLLENRFTISVNPTGVLFNPASIAAALSRVVDKKEFTENDLIHHDGEWKSLWHHSRFSGTDQGLVLSKMRASMTGAQGVLSNNSVIFVTFGTAFAFRHKDSGLIVANCYRFPADSFKRERLSIENIVSLWSPLLYRLALLYPGVRVIFSVSPVRHHRDDVTENSHSKAMLRCAIQNLVEKHPGTAYFPAYEILMDDLRDYRFYATDMAHPSEAAEEYIFSALQRSCLDERAVGFINDYARIRKARQHEIRSDLPEAVEQFAQAQISYLTTLTERYPEVDLSHDFELFNRLMEPSR